MDFRKPEHRRETFLRFYEFHLRYRAHPGAVYYVIPHLVKKYGWDAEQRYWWAYLNGCCQNPITSTVIVRRFPDFRNLDLTKFSLWFRENYPKFGWDTDRRYVKNKLEECILSYKEVLRGRSQADYFGEIASSPNQLDNFKKLWQNVIEFRYFGRLSSFSYSEYLRIIGLPVECSTLFLFDLDGSKSHRNGLCKVLGRDDLDWHDSNPGFPGYSSETLKWLVGEAHALLLEARERLQGREFSGDVNYFTLESTLCCYKSWHRPNRRYPNVYNDMFYERIRKAEEGWKGSEDLSVFWEAREKNLPRHLLLEFNPNDVGLKPSKQNHYRLTGQVIMMDKEWPCFQNDYNDSIRGK